MKNSYVRDLCVFRHKMALVLLVIFVTTGLVAMPFSCCQEQNKTEDIFYTHVQDSNIYCSRVFQPTALLNQQLQKIFCNFNQTVF